MERAGGNTRRSKRVVEMKKQEIMEAQKTDKCTLCASRQDKEENLGTPKKDMDTQDLMEDAAVALTSLIKEEVLFEKKAQNVKKKAVLAGSE
eukprot:5576326-Ditylum_brightwellii.AAC.1